MKRNLGLLKLSVATATLLATRSLVAQDALLFPIDRSSIGASLVPSNQSDLEVESGPPIELQQTCPQPYGDAWDTTSPTAWNMLELGFQISPDETPAPEIQLYSRYTCARPLERPISGR